MFAHQDPLTGLPNRAFFEARLAEAVRWGQRSGGGLALLYVDLDRFNDVSGTLGREAGDHLLREAASRLARVLDRRHTLARIGDDEFGALIEGTGRLADATQVARKLLEQCREPYVFDCVSIRLTASIGIGLYPADADDAVSLMDCADRAMHRAKIDGRDRSYPRMPEIAL